MCRSLVPGLGVWLAACSMSASFDDTRYRCEAGDPCPDGTSCVDGICAQGGGDADADADPPGSVTCASTWRSTG